jgi:hypothetical protein
MMVFRAGYDRPAKFSPGDQRDRARLALAIDYQNSPIPKLSPDDRAWLNATIGLA